MHLRTSQTPMLRIEDLGEKPVRGEGDFVLYWMIANRRSGWNFALQRAAEWASELGKPLVVLEALRSDYPWASDRLHAFVIQGMAANARAFAERNVLYFPYVEPEVGAGRGLLESLADDAAVVITDDFPCFFLPRMVAAAAEKLQCKLEVVDSNGLLPMRAAEKVFLRAVDFRRFLQKTLPTHFADRPLADPLAEMELPVLDSLPRHISDRWPQIDVKRWSTEDLHPLPIDHTVGPVSYAGGSEVADRRLSEFLGQHLSRYGEGRRDVKNRATSELSPYLHFGHVSAHQIFAALADQESWSPERAFHKATAARHGWWGMSEPAEAFLDELITWRELGYNMASKRPDYHRYESLPAWARESLELHQSDPKPYLYSLEELDAGDTHDELWNAAQMELRRDGRIHNYLRMLWGKKILEWTETPRQALRVMIELNNRYAVDGRNPNSYSGIFWCLGRYDRAWGPERSIFGKIRYMSSDSTRRKLDAKAYISEFGGQAALPFALGS